MSKLMKLFGATLLVASIANAHAASGNDRESVSCSVAIDYSLNGTVSQNYDRDYVVTIGNGFSEDISTPTRQRDFSSTLAREGGNLVVTISYFADVGVFDSTSFAAQLKLSSGKNVESTAGSMSHFHVQGTTATHTTNYTLTCRRR
jgi:hypothetical protein